MGFKKRAAQAILDDLYIDLAAISGENSALFSLLEKKAFSIVEGISVDLEDIKVDLDRLLARTKEEIEYKVDIANQGYAGTGSMKVEFGDREMVKASVQKFISGLQALSNVLLGMKNQVQEAILKDAAEGGKFWYKEGRDMLDSLERRARGFYESYLALLKKLPGGLSEITSSRYPHHIMSLTSDMVNHISDVRAGVKSKYPRATVLEESGFTGDEAVLSEYKSLWKEILLWMKDPKNAQKQKDFSALPEFAAYYALKDEAKTGKFTDVNAAEKVTQDMREKFNTLK